MKFTQDELIRLYLASVDEVHRFEQAHNKSLQWLIGIIAAIGGATVTGLLNSTKPLHFAALSVGGIGIVLVCENARAAIDNARTYWLRFIAVRSKYEQILKLTLPVENIPSDGYWRHDAIVTKEYLVERHNFDTASEWVNSRLKPRHHQWTDKIFEHAEWLGWGLIVGPLALAILKTLIIFKFCFSTTLEKLL